jgi:hypothetical protein
MAKKEVHILYWMAQNLKIIDVDGNIVPLSLNFAQHRVHKTLYEIQEKNNLPIRAVICKARREGVSTYIAGRLFTEVNKTPRRYACVCSADLDASNKVFKMVRFFQDQITDEWRLLTEYSNRKEIVYSAPHGSEFVVQTAGKDVLGRGGLTHYLHASEFAFWKNAREQFGGAAQEVPDRPGTMIILESTSFGVGGAFYEIYQQAKDDWKRTKNPANYIPIFLPWYIFPDYQMKMPDGVEFEVGKSDGTFPWEWAENEKELVAKYGLCNEQLFWRRWAIKNKCQGDLALFQQEFPADSQESFVSSGRNVFLGSRIEKIESGCKDAAKYILEPVEEHKIRANRIDQRWNCWQIWKPPDKEHSYCIGVDTMEGRQADPDDVKSDFDCHGIEVFDRDTGEFVAEYHGQGNQREVGKQALYAARMYNGAWIAPELPYGMVVLDVLKESGYDRIYQRQTHDEQIIEGDTDNLGWKTTVVTRPKMVEDFKQAVSEDSVKIYSKELVGEMRSFVYNKEGHPIHLPSKHDDLLFAAMITLQLHLRLPLKPKPYGYGSVFDEGEPRKKVLSMAFHGGKDDWVPGAASDEDLESSL